MGLFGSIKTASSGLTAQRLRLDVISNNIANANTTRTPEGGVFRRTRVVFRPLVQSPHWDGPFVPSQLDQGVGRGVRVAGLEKDQAPPRLMYDPTHPDAIKSGERQGYVEMPNVNIVEEMVDMISASRAYEANVTVVNSAKTMFQRALSIGGRS